MSIVTGLLSDFCLFLGAVLTLTGSVGLLRLPDFFTRLHGASVTESLAAPLLIIGVMLGQIGLGDHYHVRGQPHNHACALSRGCTWRRKTRRVRSA